MRREEAVINLGRHHGISGFRKLCSDQERRYPAEDEEEE
jgi:hypothetical protein